MNYQNKHGMAVNNELKLLRDAGVEPTEEVLKNVLGEGLFDIYDEFRNAAVSEFGLEMGWRFYKDGKAWLCKAVYKKKTIFWLSIWEGFFKVSFYFTEKTRPGVYDLAISPKIKNDFSDVKSAGKLIALIVDVNRKELIPDLREIISYKKSLK